MEREFQCPKCQSEQTVKNGLVRGRPKRKCRSCDYGFTPSRMKGVDVKVKLKALVLYLSGVSIRRIAVLSRVLYPSVIGWIKKFGFHFGGRPEFPEESAVVLELDEMWHTSKKNSKTMDMEGFLSKQRTSYRLGMR
mgnify:CR=1 FL=1